MAIAPDNSVREYLALEKLYERVIDLALSAEDLNVTDLRRVLDDIYNTGRDKGRPAGLRRPLEDEINDNIVLLTDGGMSESGARQHTDALVNAARKGEYDKGHAAGFANGYAEAKRKVLFALTGKEA